MTKAELLAAVEKRLKRKVAPHLLVHARKTGRVSTEPVKRRGWVSYPENAVDELIAYLEQNSRSPQFSK